MITQNEIGDVRLKPLKNVSILKATQKKAAAILENQLGLFFSLA
jgi:hypothetical protein